jgi:2-oxoglutarate ferredoxin oxidoreductase subunit gamma
MLKNEVIMAGIGGMGVLVAGQTLSRAASQHFSHTSYVPSFGFARRGGNSEFTVIFSDERISSPLLDQAQAVVLLDSSQFTAYESRVRTGGIFIVEKAGLTVERQRDDYKLYLFSGMDIAVGMGASVLVGLIMFGAYIAISESIAQELIENELNRRYGDDEKMLKRNVDAFRQGLVLGNNARK